MTQVTHKTALVVIPPESAWPPIQAIRAEHDRKVGRWMPHITLVYPFLPAGEFERAADGLPASRLLQHLQPAADSFRRGWEEAQGGETLPVNRLWEGIDAE